MRKLVERIVLYTKLDEGENKMSFRRKRDFVHDSEIRQNISKKIKNIHDDDCILLRFLYADMLYGDKQ